MPKRVDHAARRRHIAEAVLRLAATRGLDAVSLRDVAAEGGVSMGMVQYYFTSKDLMLLFACEYLLERTNQRIADRLASLPQEHSTREVLRTLFIELQPLDEERRAGTQIWLSFLARAAMLPDLEEFMRLTWTGSEEFIKGQMAAAQQRGEIPANLDPRREAINALAFADGLVSHVLVGHFTPEVVYTAVDDYLARLFGSSPGTPD